MPTPRKGNVEKISTEELTRLLVTPPLHQWLGLELKEAEHGRVVIRMPYRQELLADVDGSYIHGGMLATLADVAGDFAVITGVGFAVPTIDLRVDYLRPARPDMELMAEGNVVKFGRQVSVADVQVTGDGKQLLVARGLYSTAVR